MEPCLSVTQSTRKGIMPIQPSRLLALWIVLSSVLSGFLAWLYLPFFGTMAVAALLFLGSVTGLRLHAWKSHARAIVALQCDGGSLAYQLRSGRWIEAAIVAGGCVNVWLTVVRLKPESERAGSVYLVVVPDSMHSEDFRRLRVHLGWVGAERQPV